MNHNRKHLTKEELEARIEKLIALILLSDPDLSDIHLPYLSKQQWTSYCTAFPDEQ